MTSHHSFLTLLYRIWPILLLYFIVSLTDTAHGFSSRSAGTAIRPCHRSWIPLAMGYIPPEQEQSSTVTAQKNLLTPKVGDIVRYYDLDGGNSKGQELVGKITFLTRTSSSSSSPSSFLAEITQLEDLGDGYFAEFSSTKRMSKKTDRDILQVSPLRASFVRTEQAYKIPVEANGKVRVRQETYNIEGWAGPQAAKINTDIVEADGLVYEQLKTNLLKNAAIAGFLGTVIVNIVKGTEDAIIYFAGAIASLAYLFFLSIKTDTLASPDRKLGSNVSNLRFLMPVLVVVAVALWNQSLGDQNPLKDATNPFDRVTPEQFGSAVLGFLTYRIPLFLGQLQEALGEDNTTTNSILPGSAGMALQLATATATTAPEVLSKDTLIPVLLISGPQATGRDELVAQLLQEDDRLVSPKLVDRISDGVTFDRLATRQEFLQTDQRFGMTRDGILKAAPDSSKVVVVNADVNLAKKLSTSLSGARLIGVWVGLDSVQAFEQRIESQIDQGLIQVEDEETRESVVRARIKEIVKEIDYGLSSGIFEFTILNKDPTRSLKELKEAASYCFK